MTSCSCGHGHRGDGKGKGFHFCLKVPIYKKVLEPYEMDFPKFDEEGHYVGTEKMTSYHFVKKLYWKCTRCGREFPNLEDFEDNRNKRYPLQLGKKYSCSNY